MEYVIKKDKNGNDITVRDVQNVILDMMKEIDQICRENNIDYCLTGGSTLGAIRHGGFIPWDDDLDIAMMRSEYIKFIKVLDEKLDKEKYTFHCFEKNKKYDVTWPAMKIRKKNTYLKETNTFLFNKCPDCDGIFIDVFIYDYMAKTTIADFPLRICNQVIGNTITVFENMKINPILLKRLFKWNAKIYGKINKNSKYVADDITWIYKSPFKPLRYIYENIFPVKYVKFEDTVLPVQKDSNDYLTRRYGPNYMTPPPEKKRIPKHIVDINLHSDKPEE